jgi:RHS repeat-associated protein
MDRIDLEILVAGQRFTASFPPLPNQSTSFIWDGTDGYGRLLQGAQPVTIRVGYHYPAAYLGTPGVLDATFGLLASGVGISGSEGAPQDGITLWQEHYDTVGALDAVALGLGGWSLTSHHFYDPNARVLHLGNGARRSANAQGPVITTAAGKGQAGFSGDGGVATQATVSSPNGVAVGPDGSLYIADTSNSRIRRVGPNGIITTVAGNGGFGLSGDGGVATQATLNAPMGVAVGPDGSLYIADFNNRRIRRVGPNGIINTVAGNGGFGFSGDGGVATQANLSSPRGVAVASDGSLYIAIAELTTNRIRRVGPDGNINTVAGNQLGGFSGDGGLATQAGLGAPFGVAVGPDGSLYIADTGNRRIRRVGPDGIISTVAGNGGSPFSGDGGVATDAMLTAPAGIAVGPDGSLYIADVNDSRIRRVGPDRIITTIAGNDQFGFSGDGGRATQSSLRNPSGVAVGPDGVIYIADTNNNRIRRVGPPMPGFTATDIPLASEDGGMLYQFNSTGRHLRTLNALTGLIIHEFTYDTVGSLTSVIEKTGGTDNVTTIQHDGSGNPTKIIGPYGQETLLAVDANGFLASVTNPAGNAHQLAYAAGGLLTAFTNPRGKVSQYTYDSDGRLILAQDPAGGSTALARTAIDNNFTVTKTSALNRVTTYGVTTLSSGERQRVATFPQGLTSQGIIGTNGGRQTTYPNGTVSNVLDGPDPRWGMQAPLSSSHAVVTPGGLTHTTNVARSATLADPANPLSLTAITDTFNVNGRQSTSTYNVAAGLLTSSSAAGRQSSMMLDDHGRILSTQIPGLAATLSTYDARGRRTAYSQGSGVDTRTYSFNYDVQGRLASVTDPLLRVLGTARDAAGRLTNMTLPDGRSIGFNYDANGNVTSVTPPGRPPHNFDFTNVDLLEHHNAPDVGAGANVTQFAYDLDRRLDLVTRPDGSTADFAYDSAGRLSTITLSTGQVQFGYDLTTGNLASLTAPDGGSIDYSYDGSLRTQTAWAGTVSGTVARSYNNDFRTSALTINGSDTVVFDYDQDGLLTQAGGMTISRSAQSGFISGSALGSVTDAWTYNSFGEASSYSANFNAANLFGVQHTRDKLGRLTQKVETFGGTATTFGYTYDQAGRLTEVKINGTTVSTYTYDSNSNRLTGPGLVTPPTYDAQDRLLQYGTTVYTYTANGELLTKSATGQLTTYQYDALGNLLKVNLPGAVQIDYVNDAQNRRIGKKINGVLAQGFLYSGQLRPVAELDGSNSVVSRFVYGARGDVPEYMTKGGTTYRIVSDHLGSPRLVVDVATGAIAQRMDYDEFGKVASDTNPGFQPFGFAGGIYDTQTKLVRFGARDYDAETARWLTRDPILFAGGDSNLYGYVLNDPTNLTDRAGLQINWYWDDAFSNNKYYCSYGFCSNDFGTLQGHTSTVLDKREEIRQGADYERRLHRRLSPDPVLRHYPGRTQPDGTLQPDYGYDVEPEIDPSDDPDVGPDPAKKPEEAAKKDDTGTACDDKPDKPPCMDCVEMVKKNGRITGPCQLWPPCS